jgi:putative ABC transport system ATP-binding protein
MMQSVDSALVSVRDLSYHFGEGESRKQALFDNSFDLKPGEIVIVTGPSGSGKTTLLTLIGALRVVQEGSINVMGVELRGRTAKELVVIRRNVGFIFQSHNLFEALTAVQNVRLALGFTSASEQELKDRSENMLAQLGLANRFDYKPQALSGGQRQRVAIARALVNQPKLILADEPTAALDHESAQEVVHLLQMLAREQHSSVLLVTHDARLLGSADRIINLVDGRIVTDVSRESIV